VATAKTIVAVGEIQQRILLIGDIRINVDAALAEVHGVPTRRLSEQVKRNRQRFPQDFMSELTVDEKAEVIAKCDHLKKLKPSTPVDSTADDPR